MIARFPADDIAWMRMVEQLLKQHDVDIQRLWKTTPQIADPEIGIPFAGGLSPYGFNYREESAGSAASRQSGTTPYNQSGGTVTAGT